MGRSPAARAKMAVPRTNINDVRVKGFENHADRMSTLFRPEHGVSTQGSSRSRRGSLDLSASDDEDDDLDFIRHAKEAARRLHELNARNAAGKPPTPASRWTAARSKISTAARISGLFRGVEPGSLPPPSAERRTTGGGSGNKVYPASTPSSVRVVTSSSAAAAGPAVRDAEYGMVTPRAQSEHGSERGSVPSTPITVLHSHDAHSVPSSSAPSLAPSVVADPDPGDAPRAHPSTSAPAWNARPTSPATAVHDAHPRGPVEVDVDGRWFVSYDDYHVSMQMAALALRAKNIALDAAMKSSAVEIEQLRKEAQAKAGAPARKLTGWFSPSRKRNLALDKDTHDAKTSSAEDKTETVHTETETPATTGGTIEEIAEDAGVPMEGGSDGASGKTGLASAAVAAAAASESNGPKTPAKNLSIAEERIAEEPRVEEEHAEAAAIDAVADATVADVANSVTAESLVTAESSLETAGEIRRQLERMLQAERAAIEAERAAWSMERSQLLKERDELRVVVNDPAFTVAPSMSDGKLVDAAMSWDGDAENLAVEALVALTTALRGEDAGFDRRAQEQRATAVAKAGGVAAVLGAMASFPSSAKVQASGAEALHRMARASERARELLVAETDEVLGGGGVECLARSVDEFGEGVNSGILESSGNALLSVAASGKTEAMERRGGRGRAALRRAIETHPDATWDVMRLQKLHAWIFASCTQPQIHSSDDEDAPY